MCKVDYDSVVEPNKPIYVPGLRLKKDLGLDIIDVKVIKDVSFWSQNVMKLGKSRERIMWLCRA